MAQDATTVAAPAAAAPAAQAPAAAAAAVAPVVAAAPAAAAPAPVENVAAITAAETALATATAAAAGKPADSAEAKAAATAKSALDALKPAAAAPAKPAAKSPESYTEFTAPEGVALDKTVTDQVKVVAKELDLSQADAQKLIDKVAPVLAKSEAARITAFVTSRADAWAKASAADAEIGGEKFEENRALAMKTFDAFGTPALKDVLNKTGLGDNPEVIRWAMRIGKAIGPDNKFVAGTTLAKAGVAAEDKLWPSKT